MARFCGKVGFVTTAETAPGVWSEQLVERTYYGDVTRFTNRAQQGDKIVDDVSIGHNISIVVDKYALDNLYAIKYVIWRGERWKVITIEENYPRLSLTLGSLYNEPTQVS